MDFIPRYAQPFSLADAVKLDVAVITEEITRLQNSLKHLKETQAGLQEYIDSETPTEVDVEIAKALEENKIVIGSQEERILILNLALSEKGVHYGSHYDLNGNITASSAPVHSTPAAATRMAATLPQEESDEGGIHL